MKKSWGLTEKILSGEKKIESRWYMSKSAPWDRISEGDTVYFKNSGEPVRIRAQVEKVLQFSNLNPQKVKEILDEYGGLDGIEMSDLEKFFNLFKNKKYCMLIFLKGAKEIEPFNINKKGFGSMSAWIVTDDLDKIKI
jgi:ASC-1-like (ASCH) protein